MDKDKYISLIYKKLKGDISLEELSILDAWIGQPSDNEQFVKGFERDWKLTEQYEPQLEIDVEGDFQLLQQRIQLEEELPKHPISRDNLRVAHQPIGKVVQMTSKKTNTRWIGWATAAVLALALSFWFLNESDSVDFSTLALATQFGEKKEVQLIDGTKIWLNGNSKLEYPSDFEGNKRLVKLTGEAFFEVAKNAEKPFIIETDKAKVTVLGTSFNVRSRLDESETEVVVKTGKVRLENSKGDKKVELIANQKGVYNVSNNTILQAAENDMNELAWHSEILLYSSTPLVEVITDLSKQFEVSISMKNTAMNTCEWGGLFKTKDGVKNVLEAIAGDFNMELKEMGNTTFELIGGRCQ